MIRMIAKWYISRALDDATPIPGWVSGRLQHDKVLQQFEHNLSRLDERLRQDAADWVMYGSTRIDKVDYVELPIDAEHGWGHPMPQSRTRALSMGALAASVLLAVFLIVRGVITTSEWDLMRSGSTGTVDQEIGIDVPQPVDIADQATLRAWVATGQTWICPWTSNFDRLTGQIPSLSSAATEAWRARLNAFESRTELAFVEIESGLRDERKKMLTDAIAAAQFFTRQLPQSTAQLLGLVRSSG